MSAKRRLARTLCVAFGAQALAVGALAQTPDSSTTQRPNATATQQGSTSGSTRDTTGAASTSTSRDWDQAQNDSTRGTTGSTSGAATGTRTSSDHAGMDHSKMKSITPQSFATQAAVMGKAEVELAQLALQNTKNEEIRLYAERMVKDHTAANNKLKDIASKQNLQLPQSLDAKHQQVKQQLSGLKDAEFDREYKKHMNMSHDEAVALFESASQAQQMPNELKDFAASTLPTLERHKKLAEGLETKRGGA